MTTNVDEEASGKGLLLKADEIAATFRDEVKISLVKCSRPPKLVGILCTSSAPSKNYAEFTKKQCDQLGVEFVLKLTGAADSGESGEGEGVEEAIIEANEDESVDGIMVSTHMNSGTVLDLKSGAIAKVYYPIFGVQQVCRFSGSSL